MHRHLVRRNRHDHACSCFICYLYVCGDWIIWVVKAVGFRFSPLIRISAPSAHDPEETSQSQSHFPLSLSSPPLLSRKTRLSALSLSLSSPLDLKYPQSARSASLHSSTHTVRWGLWGWEVGAYGAERRICMPHQKHISFLSTGKRETNRPKGALTSLFTSFFQGVHGSLKSIFWGIKCCNFFQYLYLSK